MMKLLKYDWKRNENSILVAFMIWLLAQIIFTALGWIYGWDELIINIITTILYGVGGLFAFLLACQTFNGNIKAYSRRLLPLPLFYTILSPLILIIAAQVAIGLLYIAHDMLFTVLFHTNSLLSIIGSHLDVVESVSVALGILWSTIAITIVIFFAIASSHTVAGRGGTMLGIIVAVVLFSLLSWFDRLIFSSMDRSSESFGFFRLIMEETVDGKISMEVLPFERTGIGVLLFDAAIAAVLVFGIIYMIKRIKL